jgi:hypothetical protein
MDSSDPRSNGGHATVPTPTATTPTDRINNQPTYRRNAFLNPRSNRATQHYQLRQPQHQWNPPTQHYQLRQPQHRRNPATQQYQLRQPRHRPTDLTTNLPTGRIHPTHAATAPRKTTNMTRKTTNMTATTLMEFGHATEPTPTGTTPTDRVNNQPADGTHSSNTRSSSAKQHYKHNTDGIRPRNSTNSDRHSTDWQIYQRWSAALHWATILNILLRLARRAGVVGVVVVAVGYFDHCTFPCFR